MLSGLIGLIVVGLLIKIFKKNFFYYLGSLLISSFITGMIGGILQITSPFFSGILAFIGVIIMPFIIMKRMKKYINDAPKREIKREIVMKEAEMRFEREAFEKRIQEEIRYEKEKIEAEIAQENAREKEQREKELMKIEAETKKIKEREIKIQVLKEQLRSNKITKNVYDNMIKKWNLEV